MISVALAACLLPLLGLRLLAAAAETVLATAPPGRGRGLAADDALAAAARATAQVASATVVGVITSLVWMHPGRGAVPLVLALVVPTILVLCDVVPRGLTARARPARLPWLDRLLTALAVALAPLLLLERGLARLLGRRGAGVPLVALRRLGGWLAARPARGPLEVSEAGLVARIARFADKTAVEAMVPLVDVCGVPDTASAAGVAALAQESGYSRLPVYHEQITHVIGLVTSLDLIGATDPGLPVTAVMREALFVPESKPLPELLATLKSGGRNLAIVVDEYGGAVGLVTVEDLVEEIVGEIEDEYDAPRDLYRRVAPGVFLVSARTPVAEVNERFGWNLPHGEYETLGGLVLERLGRVPKAADSVTAGRVEIVVTRATARAVQELRVQERR